MNRRLDEALAYRQRIRTIFLFTGWASAVVVLAGCICALVTNDEPVVVAVLCLVVIERSVALWWHHRAAGRIHRAQPRRSR